MILRFGGSAMKRREFITMLGGAATWPLAARAQQAERVRRIGLLMAAADDSEGQARVTALKQGLQELGWTDGRNIQIETRFGAVDDGRIRAHAAELVALAPEVIVAHTTPGGGQRSRRARLRFELGASGREYHWLHVHRFSNGGEVAGDAQRGRPERYSRGAHVQPGYIPPLLRLPTFVRGHAAVSRG